MVSRLGSYHHDGLVFEVRDEGPVDGEVVVLLHGFPQTSTSWHAVAPLLHAAGYRTVAPDQRGYSPGARPRRRRDHRPSLLVGDVEALVTQLGTPVHLVGHDWGGGVGWLLAARSPHLLRTWTSVSTPHPGALLSSFVRSDQLRQSWYMGAFQLPALPERFLATPRAEVMLRKGGMSPEAVARYRREIVEGGALRGALHWYRAMAMGRPRDSRAHVRVPTTLVWSDRDVALGRRATELTERFVDAPYELVVLAGVSHWIPEEAPEQLVDAVLRRIRGGDADG